MTDHYTIHPPVGRVEGIDFDVGPSDSDDTEALAPDGTAGGGASAIPLRAPAELDRHTRVELLKEERKIAAKYHGGPMWGYVAATWGCYAIWLALFPLTMMDIVPVWVAFPIATFIATAGYIPAHEAMHDNIARPGSEYRWVNEWVGKVATIPIVFPFSLARLMHLQHHYHCNDPIKDPDYPDEAPGMWAAWYKTWYNRQPGVDGTINTYKRVVAEMGTPEAAKALKDTIMVQLLYMAVLFTMAWSGYAIEAALVWWLPRHIALSYVRFYLSWVPHHPREGRTGRYEQTKIFKSRIGHFMSMCMETHAVHHLYPGIPNHRTRDAYKELKPILEKRGVDCSAL